jgi:hypothetical protein
MRRFSTCWHFAIAMLASCATAQDALPEQPAIETIDFFGLSMPRSAALERVPFKIGERIIMSSTEELNGATARALGVPLADVAIICCTEHGLTQIFVGVQERAGAVATYRDAPTGKVRLPADIVASYEEWNSHLIEAIENGIGAEDHSQGHALSVYPPVRAQQDRFIVFAKEQEKILVDVLRHSSDGQHRAIAAHVLGYARDKRKVTKILTPAAADPDGVVRNNATRAIGVIGAYALLHPELRIEIDPAPFIPMLNSIVWTDRNKSLFVLWPLSSKREPRVLRELRAGALPSLIEMCGWTSWGRAEQPCSILRRIAGLPEDQRPESRSETLAKAGAGGAEPP